MFNYAKIITHDTNTTLNCVLLIAINNYISDETACDRFYGYIFGNVSKMRHDRTTSTIHLKYNFQKNCQIK